MTTETTAPAVAPDPFDGADYYDCDHHGSGTLRHTTPEEAVECWAEYWLGAGLSIREIIERHECEITAYRREVMTEDWIRLQAEHLLDWLAENFDEDFGHPDLEPGLADDDTGACLSAMIEAVRKVVSRGKIKHCEAVASIVLDDEELEAKLREISPSWFETSDPSSVPAIEIPEVAQ